MQQAVIQIVCSNDDQTNSIHGNAKPVHVMGVTFQTWSLPKQRLFYNRTHKTTVDCWKSLKGSLEAIVLIQTTMNTLHNLLQTLCNGLNRHTSVTNTSTG